MKFLPPKYYRCKRTIKCFRMQNFMREMENEKLPKVHIGLWRVFIENPFQALGLYNT